MFVKADQRKWIFREFYTTSLTTTDMTLVKILNPLEKNMIYSYAIYTATENSNRFAYEQHTLTVQWNHDGKQIPRRRQPFYHSH